MKTKLNLYGGFIIAPITLIGDNKSEHHFYFAIDTGSNKTILQSFVADAIGNETIKSKITLTSGSASDEVHKVYIKSLPKKLNYIDGLLGYDFFQELNLKLLLDFENNQLSIT